MILNQRSRICGGSGYIVADTTLIKVADLWSRINKSRNVHGTIKTYSFTLSAFDLTDNTFFQH